RPAGPPWNASSRTSSPSSTGPRRLLIGLSSSKGEGRCVLVGAIVAEQCPQDVDASAGEGEDGLDVALAFGAFAVIEASGVRAGLDAEQGGGVEDALQGSAVALGPVQVAADAAGVAGNGCDAGEAGELVCGGEP